MLLSEVQAAITTNRHFSLKSAVIP